MGSYVPQWVPMCTNCTHDDPAGRGPRHGAGPAATRQ
jgi:hypothetical protein